MAGGTVVLTKGLVAKRSAITQVFDFARRWPIWQIVVLSILVITGIFAPLIAPHPPNEGSLYARNIPPAWYPEGSSKNFLGTDAQGRDMLSRVIFGSRISLTVSVAVIILGGLVGVALGLISGYFGGLVDELIMRTVDLQLAVPGLLIILVAVVVFGQSLALLVGILAIFGWGRYARQVRAETLQLKNMDYVALAMVAGASSFRILVRHILPGVWSTVMIVSSLNVGGLILTEATLSFLGAGVPPPTPSWGSMVSEGRTYLVSAWWIAFFPGVAIFLVVMAAFFFVDWLRDYLDPRLRQAI